MGLDEFLKGLGTGYNARHEAETSEGSYPLGLLHASRLALPLQLHEENPSAW
jgi:hypothetical protein